MMLHCQMKNWLQSQRLFDNSHFFSDQPMILSIRNLLKARFGLIHFIAVWACLIGIGPLSAQSEKQQPPNATSRSIAETKNQPNILLIMADDLGFSDLGCYGGEIETPNLDTLAENGLRFTQFYNTARCWPTRAALLTGYYAQQVRRDALPEIKIGKRPAFAKLLPELLRPARYRSYHSGKWHLDGMPLQSGFDRSYYLKDQGRFFNPKIHWKDDRKLDPVDAGSDYYATTVIADHAIDCLKTHHAKHSGKPFFHYLAFTAPHFPLHALPEDIKKYDDRYQVGWDSIREKRWKRIKELGIVSGEISAVESKVGPPYNFPNAMKKLGDGEVNRPLPWDQLSPKQKTLQAKKMAIHAAMIDRMDQEIGRVLDQLKSMKQFENTLILFLSDNGASAEIMVRADGHDPNAPAGSGKSYLCLGPGWSTACNTPFRRHKTWVHEGGIRTPLIAHWPSGLKAKNQLEPTLGHVVDVVPTLLELADVKSTDPSTPERPGRSVARLFSGKKLSEDKSIWWLHEGNRALRIDNWKIVAAKNDPWSIFNMKDDPAETNDLAKSEPERISEMNKRWQSQLDQFIKSMKK